MKYALLAASILLTTPAVAQLVYKGPEVSTPAKGVTVLTVHLPDSAKTAYAATIKGLLAAGYGIDRSDSGALFISTPTKSVNGKVFLLIQAVSSPTVTGSDVAFRGTYTWVSAATIMAHVENRQLPAQFVAGGGSPPQLAWNELQRVVSAIFPNSRVTYK